MTRVKTDEDARLALFAVLVLFISVVIILTIISGQRYNHAMNAFADVWCQDQNYTIEIEPEKETCVANYSMYRADFIIEVRPKTDLVTCDSARMCIGFSVLTNLSYNSYFKEVRGEHIEYGNGYSREQALKDFEGALKTFYEKYPTTDYDFEITNGTERLEFTYCEKYRIIPAKTETRHYSTGNYLANESKIECLGEPEEDLSGSVGGSRNYDDKSQYLGSDEPIKPIIIYQKSQKFEVPM